MDKWQGILANMVDVIDHRLAELGVNQSNIVAKEVVLSLANYNGGRAIYLPKGDIIKTAMRDRQIYQEFTGHNHDYLALQHQLTNKRIYEIIAQQRLLNSQQAKLF